MAALRPREDTGAMVRGIAKHGLRSASRKVDSTDFGQGRFARRNNEDDKGGVRRRQRILSDDGANASQEYRVGRLIGWSRSESRSSVRWSSVAAKEGRLDLIDETASLVEHLVVSAGERP